MSIYRLERGLVVQIGERKLAFQRQLDDSTIQLEDVRTGAFSTFKTADLVRKISKGDITVLGQQANGLDSDAATTYSHAAADVVALRLNERQTADWERRCQYVFSLRKRGVSRGQRTQIAKLVLVIAEGMQDSHPPSASSAMKWMRDFEQHGANTQSLVSRNAFREKRPRIEEWHRQLVHEMLRKHYFIRNGESLAAVCVRLNNHLSQKTSHSITRSMSESTVRRICAQTDPYQRDRARYGAAYAAAKWRHAIGGVYATRPMQRVEMDHTVLDLYVLDDKRGIPLGRPTVTILIDAYSGYILSIYISFEGGSIGRIAQAIKGALVPKDDLVKSLGLTNTWHTPGLWETLVVDNGLEFHSAHLRAMTMDLCCDLEYCPVRKPWFKPVVERAMLEMTRILPIQGRPEKFFGVKDAIDPSIKACVMFSDLCACLTKWVVDVYPITINERKLARPLDLLLEGLEHMPAPVFVDDLRSLDIIGGIAKKMRVRHTGIEMFHLTYRSRELAEMAKQIAPSFPVTIKMNADDLGSIWVQHPKELTWLNVPATNSAYASGLTLYQHKLIRKHAKERLRSSNASEVLLKAQAELQGMWDLAVRSGKKLKRSAAKQLARLDGTRSSVQSKRDTTDVPLRAEQIITREELKVTDEEPPEFESFNLSKKLG